MLAVGYFRTAWIPLDTFLGIPSQTSPVYQGIRNMRLQESDRSRGTGVWCHVVCRRWRQQQAQCSFVTGDIRVGDALCGAGGKLEREWRKRVPWDWARRPPESGQLGRRKHEPGEIMPWPLCLLLCDLRSFVISIFPSSFSSSPCTNNVLKL